MKQKELFKNVLIWGGIIAITLVSWHSVQEIHYLKTFYTGSFTVVDAGWATLVELIKVTLISFPLLLMMKQLKK